MMTEDLNLTDQIIRNSTVDSQLMISVLLSLTDPKTHLKLLFWLSLLNCELPRFCWQIYNAYPE